MRTFAKVLGYALVALLLVGAIGLIYKFTNGFNEDFKTFYVECDGKQILTTDNKMTFVGGNVYKFDVKYTFEKNDGQAKDYSVKIVPNVENDFEFTVDEAKKLYSKEKDLSAGFEIVKSDTSFEIYIDEGATVQSVLSKVYDGKSVNVPAAAEARNSMPFKLVVSSYNDKVSINIAFNIGGESVTGVALDKTDLVFDNKSVSP